MAASQHGTGGLAVNGQPTISGYLVESWDIGGGSPEIEDVKDAAGAQHTRIVYENRMAKVGGVLMALGASAGAEFPEGGLCTATGYEQYYVDSCVKSTTKGVTRFTVSMTRCVFT